MTWLQRLQRLAAVAAVAATAISSRESCAQVIIGNWESGTPEGWIDWSGPPAQSPLGAPRFAFNSIGATAGSGAVQFNLPAGGYTQWASIKLQMVDNGVNEWRDDFMASHKLAADITLVASEMTVLPANNFASIGLFVNAQGYGFTNQGNPESVTPFVGFNGTNAFNPQQLPAGSSQTSTWIWDIADTHDGVGTDITPNPTYVELIFDTFSNGGVVYHIDNVRLIAVPEPASFGLVCLSALALVAVRGRLGRRG